MKRFSIFLIIREMQFSTVRYYLMPVRMKVKVTQSCPVFETPWTIQFMEFSRPEYRSEQPFPSPRDPPNPGIKPRLPALQADSLPAEPQGKPENTGVGSLSLLQHIFLTQDLNRGLLHCKQILLSIELLRKPQGRWTQMSD